MSHKIIFAVDLFGQDANCPCMKAEDLVMQQHNNKAASFRHKSLGQWDTISKTLLTHSFKFLTASRSVKKSGLPRGSAVLQHLEN